MQLAVDLDGFVEREVLSRLFFWGYCFFGSRFWMAQLLKSAAFGRRSLWVAQRFQRCDKAALKEEGLSP
jgi:hypothetical protein